MPWGVGHFLIRVGLGTFQSEPAEERELYEISSAAD